MRSLPRACLLAVLGGCASIQDEDGGPGPSTPSFQRDDVLASIGLPVLTAGGTAAVSGSSVADTNVDASHDGFHLDGHWWASERDSLGGRFSWNRVESERDGLDFLERTALEAVYRRWFHAEGDRVAMFLEGALGLTVGETEVAPSIRRGDLDATGLVGGVGAGVAFVDEAFLIETRLGWRFTEYPEPGPGLDQLGAQAFEWSLAVGVRF